ncbi:D-aminoacyl-tRNA deacylase [Rothia sp. ZJ1223]|uniref:D-aminoacyl-tRNA deacylase n=1 Tax=Rothia sp. ZJ1223 TaxID=2811098 RepID=UPI001958A3DD|nr:D-aminoacyl-tRNA deacylase [Rothia sp. ZJ1223]MBM7050484.1 D-tyrosyl-tRNA(Tyr) deacylase [Rothia sp. ZJ1223]
MKVVLQRVSSASVEVDGAVVGSIEGAGLLALVGITHADGQREVAKLAEKTLNQRIFAGEKSAADIGAPLLVVSQFTLYADMKKGRRPSWSQAAPGAVSEPIYEAYVQALRDAGAQVETGVFGADMQVSLVNDGPVTLLLDSEDLL